MIRKVDALLTYFMHIPFPERLSDEVWAEKWQQLKWLAEKELLGNKKIEF